MKSLTPREVYPKDRAYLLVIYDLRIPGAAGRLRRELVAWRGYAQVEPLDSDHVALILCPGLAGEITTPRLPNEKGVA
jgi:hypothetical protein